ncbi:ester cyclase [Salibacterium aidingense]|uniref:ester cyclase n=1 Tax=Salibacterium aidingense TaxID=384933 RepID=UPI000A063687
MREAFPDIYYEVQQVVVDVEMSAVHWIPSGTHQGGLQAIPVPPTNKQASIRGIHFLRFSNGKIEEVCCIWSCLAWHRH